MKRRVAYLIVNTANWIMDYIPVIGYPIGNWMKDWKLADEYYREDWEQ